jgi:signal recognition particle receptor subunit beta
MALFNYATKEITLKIVYYGPGLSGKTTNLQYIHETLEPERKGKLLALSTETDRTLFFDFLPVRFGKLKDFDIRFQLYTVPGQVRYDSTRKLVLKGADAVIFVADSQRQMKEQNIESLENMRDNLIANNIDPGNIPLVLQYNKRDLSDILSVKELNADINAKDNDYVLAEAINGKGVSETLQSVTKLLLKDIAKKHNIEIKPEEKPRDEPKEEKAIAGPVPPAPPPKPMTVEGEPVFEISEDNEIVQPGASLEPEEETVAGISEDESFFIELTEGPETEKPVAPFEPEAEAVAEPSEDESFFELTEETETEKPDISIEQKFEAMAGQAIAEPLMEAEAEPISIEESAVQEQYIEQREMPSYASEKIEIMFGSLIELSNGINAAVAEIARQIDGMKADMKKIGSIENSVSGLTKELRESKKQQADILNSLNYLNKLLSRLPEKKGLFGFLKK